MTDRNAPPPATAPASAPPALTLFPRRRGAADTLPIRPEPTGELAADIVVPRVGVYRLTVVKSRSCPGAGAAYDERTGHWLTVTMLNVASGEVVRPVNLFVAAPGPRPTPDPVPPLTPTPGRA